MLANVPFAFCAIWLVTLFFCGCERQPEPPAAADAAPPAHAPASYMHDPAFRRAVEEKAAELRAIVKERAPLVERMKALVKEHREDLVALRKISEWNDLHRRIVQLNAKYENVRKRQLAVARARLAPPAPAQAAAREEKKEE